MNFSNKILTAKDIGVYSTCLASGHSGEIIDQMQTSPLLAFVFIDRENKKIYPVSTYQTGNKTSFKMQRFLEALQNTQGKTYIFETLKANQKTIFPLFDNETSDPLSYLKDYLDPKTEKFARRAFSPLLKGGMPYQDFINAQNQFMAIQLSTIMFPTPPKQQPNNQKDILER